MAINFRELFALRANRLMIPAATIAALVAAGAPPAWATNFAVTNTADSLRQAILDLNLAGAGTHTIAFNAALGTISLADNLPPILGTGQDITITGNGNAVDGGSNYSLLFIGGGTVAVSNLSLENGLAQGGRGATVTAEAVVVWAPVAHCS